MTKQKLINFVKSQAGHLYWRKIWYADYPYGKSTYQHTARDAVLDVLHKKNIKLSIKEIWKIINYVGHGEE